MQMLDGAEVVLFGLLRRYTIEFVDDRLQRLFEHGCVLIGLQTLHRLGFSVVSDIGVDLRRRQRRMTQQLLRRSQIRARRDQPSPEPMVDAYVAVDA